MLYLVHIAILAGIYSILSASLGLITGFCGLVSLCHASFFGIGAYTAGLLAVHHQSSFFLSITAAFWAGASFGALVAIPSLRVRKDFLVIATFSFQVIVYSMLNNWISLTGGPLGISGIPKPQLGFLNLSSDGTILILVAILMTAVFFVVNLIVRSPFGRVLRAIREDEVLARAAGKNVARYKLLVFMIGAGMAGMAGALYAHYISFIDPTSFTVMESIFILSIVIIGGVGSMWGPLVGACILISMPELLRLVGLPNAVASNVRQIIYGGALVAFMIWRPQGLLGEYFFKNEDLRT